MDPVVSPPVADPPPPRVELLFSADCPSFDAAWQQLRTLIEQAGLDPAAIELRLLLTEAEALAENFPGSPTIRVGGIDIVDPAGAAPSLGCRVYRSAGGGFSPLPSDDEIQTALTQHSTDPAPSARHCNLGGVDKAAH